MAAVFIRSPRFIRKILISYFSHSSNLYNRERRRPGERASRLFAAHDFPQKQGLGNAGPLLDGGPGRRAAAWRRPPPRRLPLVKSLKPPRRSGACILEPRDGFRAAAAPGLAGIVERHEFRGWQGGRVVPALAVPDAPRNRALPLLAPPHAFGQMIAPCDLPISMMCAVMDQAAESVPTVSMNDLSILSASTDNK